MSENRCSLLMQYVLVDELVFKRMGLRTESELKIRCEVETGQKKDSSEYRVKLALYGIKENEYEFTVKISGFFEVVDVSAQQEEMLIQQNAVAILMPYVRTQVSLLTAHPETECVVLPPFNIVELLKTDEPPCT